MREPSPDRQLIGAYAAEASESAFHGLVSRHVNLVFATALRQLGDSGAAEEITQNVFVALARKAPRLTGVETLAGWLHRTTILEAKARIRADLRRRRREETAGQLMELQRDGVSPLASMVPILDEALLHLRERDRLVLILRYFQERSLREVGAAMGVDEDAARKRISRALDRVTDFFRRRGFVLPSGASAAALLSSSATAAPIGLVLSATQAGIGVGSAAGGVNFLLLHVMALTKTQTAVCCALVAATPLLWQRHAEARVQQEQARIAAQVTANSQQVDAVEAEARSVRDAVIRVQADTVNAEHRLTALNAQRRGAAPRPAYHWDDSAAVVRVPKKFLEQLSISATANRRGQLTEQIKELLQLNESEVQRTQEAIDRFLADYHSAQGEKIRPVPPNQNELADRNPEDVRVFEVPGVAEKLRELRHSMLTELEAVLGPDRFRIFRKGLQNWMPLEDRHHGLNSGMAVLNFDHREQFFRPKPGDRWLEWGVASPNNSMWVSILIDDLPPFFRAQLADWIAVAQSQPPTP